jgi:hypothetical protein
VHFYHSGTSHNLLKTSRLSCLLLDCRPVMPRRPPRPDSLRVELAHALGFPNYPDDITADPYLNYLMNQRTGTQEQHTKLLLKILDYFDVGPAYGAAGSPTRSIQGLIDALSIDTESTCHDTPNVEDVVLCAIGTWTMLLDSFVLLPLAGGVRKISLAYGLRACDNIASCQPYQEDLAGLITGSGLLPAPARLDDMALDGGHMETVKHLYSLLKQSPTNAPASPRRWDSSAESRHLQNNASLGVLDNLDSLESLSIKCIRLNIWTLKAIGAVVVVWTHNISRHLLLSKRNGQHALELFALPCALDATSLQSKVVGISPELSQENSLLFNAWPDIPRHAKFGVSRFCWCWSCSAKRYRSQSIARYKSFTRNTQETDSLLINLMRKESSDWTPDIFPCLWSRVMILEEHLRVAKPISLWILFRDRRDTLQFWTFL